MKTPILFDVYEIKEAIKVCKHVCMCVFIHVDTAQGRAWITRCVLARSLATFVILAPQPLGLEATCYGRGPSGDSPRGKRRVIHCQGTSKCLHLNDVVGAGAVEGYEARVGSSSFISKGQRHPEHLKQNREDRL